MKLIEYSLLKSIFDKYFLIQIVKKKKKKPMQIQILYNDLYSKLIQNRLFLYSYSKYYYYYLYFVNNNHSCLLFS